MIKHLAIICLCVGLVASQSCTDTQTLRTVYGFGNTVTTPTQASGVNYCSGLKTSTSCCTASDINSVQAKSDALIKNLTNLVITRDQYYKTAAVDPLGQLRTATTNFANSITTLSTLTSTDPTTMATEQALSESLTSLSQTAASLQTDYAANVANTNLGAFQAARTTCVVEIVKLQAAAWCLSCDPNAATKGFDPNNGIVLSAATCTTLKNACYPFVSTSSFQSGPITVQFLIASMNYFTTLVNKLKNNQAITEADFNYVPTSPPVGDVPDSCSSAAACDFICTDLWGDGLVDQDDLIAGGDTSSGERRLADRSLQSGSFAPGDNEAGTTVTFQNDPGNANTKSSEILSFRSVLIGAMMLLFSYLL